MTKILKTTVALMVLSLVIFTSCVPARKLEEAQAKQKSCEDELAKVKGEFQGNEAKIKELNEQLARQNKELSGLLRDTTIMGTGFRSLTRNYDKINYEYDILEKKFEKLLALNEKENAKLSGDLNLTREQLLKKEEELKMLEMQLNKQKAELELLSLELKKREARVNELEDILKKKDQAVMDLKKKLSDALVGFENKGLTITNKNGKVYVSMDESLLFASGKTAVEAKGVEALKNLAKVLEQNTDINVMVEGHTDDVPMKGTGDIKDNWDLSVMRATSVTKIILGGTTIDPKRITSAGRGEFFPLDPAKTPEARKKNRRTEIILTPKLDELFKVLDNN